MRTSGNVLRKASGRNGEGLRRLVSSRHGNHEFNEVTRGRIHAKLRQLELHVPTREEQEQDQRAADTYYQSCTEDLIRRTRDSRKFPLVFKALTEYGFRRNLLGLKGFGRAPHRRRVGRIGLVNVHKLDRD